MTVAHLAKLLEKLDPTLPLLVGGLDGKHAPLELYAVLPIGLLLLPDVAPEGVTH